MAWYDEAIFYHIYPLGLTGAPKTNPGAGQYGDEESRRNDAGSNTASFEEDNSTNSSEHRLNQLIPWAHYLAELGITALYIGPLFEAGSHGYDTADYRRLDRRLGDNGDLASFVRECHSLGIRVVLDAVFNHTGREFFAFRDLKEHRENSRYKDWYCGVNFWGNNEYNDGFSYDNWGGYNLLVKLNVWNPEVREYLYDTVRFWVREFDIDGLRLDAADVLDFGFMQGLRAVADEVKPDFWLMGEVIHGEYTRWLNDARLHSVTDYAMRKGLYSGHNDHNYFEIAHTLNRSMQNGSDPHRLYRFCDNHDVDRIINMLNNRQHWFPLQVLVFGMPGIPSIYYGSEFGIEGRKENGSDDGLRPALRLEDFLGGNSGTQEDATPAGRGRLESAANPYLAFMAALIRTYHEVPALARGDYEQLVLTNRQYAFRRGDLNQGGAIVAVNNDEAEAGFWVRCPDGAYRGLLGGAEFTAAGGGANICLGACAGEIFVRKQTV